MKEIAATAVVLIVLLVGVTGAAWALKANSFLFYQFWAPKEENLRRNVYENTLSFQKGSADRLASLCNQVNAAPDDQKGMLRHQIEQEFSSMNTTDAPDYLQGCLSASRN